MPDETPVDAGVNVTLFVPEPPFELAVIEDEERLCVNVALTVTVADDEVVEL